MSFNLAQAQECVFQRALIDKLKNGSIARVAQKVGDLYEHALDMANDARGAGGIWPTFVFPSVRPTYLVVNIFSFLAAANLCLRCYVELATSRYVQAIPLCCCCSVQEKL